MYEHVHDSMLILIAHHVHVECTLYMHMYIGVLLMRANFKQLSTRIENVLKKSELILLRIWWLAYCQKFICTYTHKNFSPNATYTQHAHTH